MAGSADISMASRPLSQDEKSSAREKGLTIRETIVARMGIAVIVHRDNPVSSVAVGKLAEIFSGDIQKLAGGRRTRRAHHRRAQGFGLEPGLLSQTNHGRQGVLRRFRDGRLEGGRGWRGFQPTLVDRRHRHAGGDPGPRPHQPASGSTATILTRTRPMP